MRLISIVHVSTALLWAVFAAPAHPLSDLTATVDAAPAYGEGTPSSVHASSVTSDIFKTISLPRGSHTSAQEEATYAPEALELDQKQKKPGSFENNCVIA
ncbi:hypothetical protein C8R44DRAFT_819364 [Mycena epipterygia]|nr:hypothetical protein C8R44DRAFT_819364 [Mycena epipterygia]